MRRKRILFATDSFDGQWATANGVCVSEIAGEFVKNRYEVHILCFKHKKEEKEEKKYSGMIIHRIDTDIVNKLRFYYESKNSGLLCEIAKLLMIIINRLEAVMFLKWYPMRRPLFCYSYYNRMERLQKMYNYDMIVASYCPFEAVYSIYRMKKKYNVKTCMYALDSLSNFTKRFFMSGTYQNRKGYEWEKKIYKSTNLILNMKCHEVYYNKKRYDLYRDKMKIVDFPHIIKYKLNSKETENKNRKKTLIYAGSIRGQYIQQVLEILSDILKNHEYEFLIYGGNSVKDIGLSQDNLRKLNVRLMGRISHGEMLKIEDDADCLISMGNVGSSSSFVPSKIFEYISLGLKIIHFYENEDDSCLDYFERYPNCCIVSVKNNIETSKKRIYSFLTNHTERIGFENISRKFAMNTPQYTFHIIDSYVKMRG